MRGSLRQLSLTELGNTIGTPPASNLVGSIQSRGVLQPIIVSETPMANGAIALNIIDGNRRVAAARIARIEQIPAIVFTDITPADASSVTLILNSFRASNYLTEFWAIRQLERDGFNEPDIKSIGGLSSSRWNQRSSLSDLDRELFIALRNSEIFQTHAVEIAKLPEGDQQILAARFRSKGRLTQKDLDPYKIRKSRKSDPPPTSSVSWETDTYAPITRGGHSQPHSNHRPVSTSPEPPLPDRPSIQVSSDLHTWNTATTARPDTKPATNDPDLPYKHQASDIAATIPQPGTIFKTRLNTLIHNTVVAARDMDFSREEFLEFAARKWDEANG